MYEDRGADALKEDAMALLMLASTEVGSLDSVWPGDETFVFEGLTALVVSSVREFEPLWAMDLGWLSRAMRIGAWACMVVMEPDTGLVLASTWAES